MNSFETVHLSEAIIDLGQAATPFLDAPPLPFDIAAISHEELYGSCSEGVCRQASVISEIHFPVMRSRGFYGNWEGEEKTFPLKKCQLLPHK